MSIKPPQPEDTLFERAWPLLEPAAKEWGQHTKDSVWRALQNGRRLWLASKSAAITEVIGYPSGLRVGQAWLAGGDLEELVAMTDPMIAWAKSYGCTQVRIQGRRGWLRAAPDFREIGTVIARDV